jgi:hypothetical protein
MNVLLIASVWQRLLLVLTDPLLLLAFFSQLVMLVISWKRDKDRTPKTRPWLVIFLIISITMVVYASYTQIVASEESIKRNEELKGERRELLDGNKALIAKLDGIEDTVNTVLSEVRTGTQRPTGETPAMIRKRNWPRLREARQLQRTPPAV